MINSKLDKIINALIEAKIIKVKEKPAVSPKAEIKKPAAKKKTPAKKASKKATKKKK